MISSLSKKSVDSFVGKLEESTSSSYHRNLKGFEIAKMYYDVGALESARIYVSNYLSVRESSASAHQLKGQLLESLGDKESALVSYKRSYELDPSASETLTSILRLQSVASPFELEEARHWLKQGLVSAPKSMAVSKLTSSILAYEGSRNGSALEAQHSGEEPSEGDRSVVIPTNFFSTPKASSSGKARFAPRPSPDKLSAQVKSLESKQEGFLHHLDERLDSLEEKQEGLSKLLSEVLYEVRQGKTISQNVATEMTLLKKDLKDRDELRMKDITNAVAATVSAITSLQQQHQQQPPHQAPPPSTASKESEEELSLLKQRLKEAEKHAALQQAAFLQFASGGYAAALGGGVRAPPLPATLLRPDMPPVLPQQIPQPSKPSWIPTPLPDTQFVSPNMRQTPSSSHNVAPPSNIVISSSDKIPVMGKDPVPTFSGSVTIPPEHRLGVRPLPLNNTSLSITPVSTSLPSHSFQINLPGGLSSSDVKKSSELLPSSSLNGEAPAPITTTSILSKIPDPVYSAVGDSGESGSRQRQVSVNSVTTDDDDHDPCPDFKPIIPLPEEVEVVTGEEEEEILFEDRSKLYRFVDKEWKERGLGQIKILMHKTSGKVRLLMRREQTHKICANHHILPDIKVEKMKNQEKAVTWSANDFSDEEVQLENFSARFKTAEQADTFLEAFTTAQTAVSIFSSSPTKGQVTKTAPFLSSGGTPKTGKWECSHCYISNDEDKKTCVACEASKDGKVSTPVVVTTTSFGGSGFSFKTTTPSSTPIGVTSSAAATTPASSAAETKPSPFSTFSFGLSSNASPLSTGFNFGTPKLSTDEKSPFGSTGSKVEPFSFGGITAPKENNKVPLSTSIHNTPSKNNNEDSYAEEDEEHDPCPDFKPIIPLPEEVEVVTGEEEEEILFESRSKLFRLVEKEWKERGLGQIKILKHKTSGKVRLLMRREQTHKICANHFLNAEMMIERMKAKETAAIWAANDFSDEEVKLEKFCARFKTPELASEFIDVFNKHKDTSGANSATTPPKKKEESKPVIETLSSMDKFKPKPGSWECSGCMCRNEASVIKCPACETVQPGKEAEVPKTTPAPALMGSVGKSGFTFGNTASPSSSTTGFVFGSSSPAVVSSSSTSSVPSFTTTVTAYKPPTEVKEESELSFKDQSLKLNTAADAEEVVQKVQATKDMHILTLSGNTVGIEAAEAIGKALEAHSEFRRAHWKDMFTGRMKTEIPPALKHLSKGIIGAGAQLVELDLSDNAFGPIGMEGLRDLLQSPACYSLKELRLNNTGCGVTGGEHLAELLGYCIDKSTTAGHPLALRVFVLGRSRQENQGAIALAKVFKRMSSLEEVSMPQNGIYHEGIAALCDAFRSNPGLRILNMNDNTFTTKGAESLSEALTHLPALEVLNIGDCLLKTEGAIKVASAIRKGHASLRELHMDSNEILEEGGLSIVDAVANKEQLQLLSIDGNMFGSEGCRVIMDKLSAVKKEHLVTEFEDDQEPDEFEEEDLIYGEEDESEEEGESEEEEDGSDVNGVEKSSPTGVFGGKSNIFSSQNGSGSSNLFGASSNSSPNNNIFGSKIFGDNASKAANNTFGGETPKTSNIFGGGDSSKANMSFGGVDGGTTPKTTPNIFGGGESSSKTTNIFGGGDTPKTTSIFFNISDGLYPSSTGLPSFASLSDKSNSGFTFGKKNEEFSFEGAGSSVFGKSTKAALNSSKNEDPEEEDHDPYFEPIIELPELVDVKSGEEEEKVLFSHRSKAYRYESSTKEWKERGIGDIKILEHEDRNTFRVLLRRDQIHKIAVNHLITEDMSLSPLATSTTALCWFAMDFSEEESKLEQLAVKFKEEAKRNEFKNVFEKCQEKLKSSTKET
eukprot:TRINITY_DN3341_c0_g1_i2.p1 TRINITY_DN3341_c0_g1~~TRINITY_DN3341_c0_g1_i2.p1  ORF type:complete len:1855 (+),score=585.20 TRINITY_DN3341_c0_g1_i2:261-5825(+)